ncbi:MAG: hypothetical protein ACYDD9_06780 [Acidithiobacillus sp.]|jgi:hypothetical protein
MDTVLVTFSIFLCGHLFVLYASIFVIQGGTTHAHVLVALSTQETNAVSPRCCCLLSGRLDVIAAWPDGVASGDP